MLSIKRFLLVACLLCLFAGTIFAQEFRGQGLNLWDLSVSKNFRITETVKFQLRSEFLNAFNTPVFNNPNLDPRNANFGKVTSQANLARNVQIGLKMIF